jgi:hypothetical protein
LSGDAFIADLVVGRRSYWVDPAETCVAGACELRDVLPTTSSARAI